MNDTTNGTALTTIKPEAITEIMSTAPGALSRNRTAIDNAKTAGQAILDTIEGNGMSDELDSRCNNYLVRARKTQEEMMERRKPITQIFDAVKKEFTTLENALDPKNKDSVYALIQAARDKYARDKAEEQRKKEAEIQRQLALDKEVITLRNDAELQLTQHFNDYLTLKRSLICNCLDTMSLQNFDSRKKEIETFSADYPEAHFETFVPKLTPLYVSREKYLSIIDLSKVGKFNEFSEEFNSSMQELKLSVLDRLPGKKKILEELEKANATKRKAMEEQQERIRKENEEKEKMAATERDRKAQEQAEQNKLSQNTEALFNATAEIQFAENQAQVRESFEIEVLNPLGYLLITQFYFEKEGKSESIERLEKKTLGSMKGFCEKWAMKNDEKIQSAFLKYNEKLKTVAKKNG